MRVCVWLLLSLLLLGVATTSSTIADPAETGRFLDAHIGRMTFRQAVRTWGPPVRSAPIGNGEVVALWQDERQEGPFLQVPNFGIMPWWVPSPILPPPRHGWRMELTFAETASPGVSVLRGWRYQEW